MRNLGFEDTPDYDYLRELFTQVLRNAGEVEDGEYDWMKLNDGKGWEAMKQHPSAAHLPHPNAGTSNRPLHDDNARHTSTPIPPGALNKELPKPGAERRRQGQPYPDKRKSAGNLADAGASMQPQTGGQSQARPYRPEPQMQTSRPQPPAQVQQEEPPKEGGFKKFMKMLCCA